jgi:hypothetical protein
MPVTGTQNDENAAEHLFTYVKLPILNVGSAGALGWDIFWWQRPRELN